MSNSLLLGKQVLCSGEPGTLDHLFDALTNQKAVNGTASVVIAALENRYRVTDQSPKLDAGASVELLDGETVLRVGVVQPHSNLLRFGVAIANSHDMNVPQDWIVMTSTRPLFGHKRAEDASFLRGRFRAAIDPTDSLAGMYIEENRKLAGNIVVACSREEMLAMALVDSKYADRYLDQFAGEELWDVLQPQVADLNQLDYGSVLIKLNHIKRSNVLTAVTERLSERGDVVAVAGKGEVPQDEGQGAEKLSGQGASVSAVPSNGEAKPEPIKWFGTEDKANAYLQKAGLTKTHQWVKNDRRFEIFKIEGQDHSKQNINAAEPSTGAPAKHMPVGSYREAHQWVIERAGELGMTLKAFTATDEYDGLYPVLEQLYQEAQSRPELVEAAGASARGATLR